MNNVARQMLKVRLKEVCDRITVGFVGPMADKYVDDGVPFLRSQNIAPFRLNLDPGWQTALNFESIRI